MKKIMTVATASIILLSFNHLALAAIHDHGAYVEGNVGTLYSSFSFFGENYTQFGSVGANANLGYHFNKYFAAEAGYTNYGANALNNIDVAARFSLPLTNDFSLFAKIGPAYVFKNSDRTLVPFAGIGASYSLTQQLDANVQVQSISDGFFSLGLLSGGLTYHFA